MRFLNAITQGDSLDFEFALANNESVSEWVCTIYVKKKPSDTEEFNRVIEASGNTWPGYLTSDETAALTEATWYLIAEMANSTTNERQTEYARFRITETWTP